MAGRTRRGLSRFLASRYDLEKSRSTAKTGKGFQPDIWRAFADELGILGATLPEEHGGIGGGPVEMMLIAEALGHALVIEPFVDTAVVAAGLLRRAGATGLLDRVVAGDAIVTLAATEPTSGEHWQDVSTVAEARRRPVGAARNEDRLGRHKQRQQFGQPIGSFQVLQHRMVDMYMEVEQAAAAVYLTIMNLGADHGVGKVVT